MTTHCTVFLRFWLWGFEFKIYQKVLIKHKHYINYSIFFWKVLANKIAKSCDLTALLLDMVCFIWAISHGRLKPEYCDFNAAYILIYEDKSEVVLKNLHSVYQFWAISTWFLPRFYEFSLSCLESLGLRSYEVASQVKMLAVKLEFQIEFNPWDPHSKRKEPNSGLLKGVCAPTHMYSHFYACAGVHIFTYKHTQIIKWNVIIILKSFQFNHQAVCTHFSLSSSLYISI